MNQQLLYLLLLFVHFSVDFLSVEVLKLIVILFIKFSNNTFEFATYEVYATLQKWKIEKSAHNNRHNVQWK